MLCSCWLLKVESLRVLRIACASSLKRFKCSRDILADSDQLAVCDYSVFGFEVMLRSFYVCCSTVQRWLISYGSKRSLL